MQTAKNVPEAPAVPIPAWLQRKLSRASKPGVSRAKERRAIEAARKLGLHLWWWRTAMEDFQLPSRFGQAKKKRR